MRPCNMRPPVLAVAPESSPPPPVLPHELILEILLRLPVKSLVRFKFVCKFWNSLISDPQFAKLHLDRSSAKNADFAHLRLLIPRSIDDSGRRYASSCSVSSFIQNPNLAAQDDYLYELKDKFRVFGSCNGLISMLSFIKGELLIHIWNPATRSISQKSQPLVLAGIIFKSTNFGFGYDYLTDTYKVVMCFARNFVQVYSLSDNSCWRNIESLPSFPSLGQGAQDGVYLQGTLNWVACDGWDSHRFHIVSVDLRKETYAQLSLPYPPDEYLDFEPVIGVLRDCLCISHHYSQTYFVVWQMNDFGVGESWTRLVNVSNEYLETSGYSKFYYGMILLCMSENGDILMLSDYDPSQAFLLNQRDNILQRIEIPNISLSTDGNVKYYLESLITPC